MGSNPTAVSRACLSPAPTRCLGGAWLRDAVCGFAGPLWHSGQHFLHASSCTAPRGSTCDSRSCTSFAIRRHPARCGCLRNAPDEALRGFEPRLLDSESRVLTVTPQGQLKATRSPQYLPSNLQRKQHWQSRRRRHRRHRSSIRILCGHIRIGFQVRFWAPPPLSTRGGAWLRDNAVCAYLTLQKPCTETQTVWPSGLRRWLQAPVRKGVGSNPTAANWRTKT